MTLREIEKYEDSVLGKFSFGTVEERNHPALECLWKAVESSLFHQSQTAK